MGKLLMLGLIGILIGVLAACGGNGDSGNGGGAGAGSTGAGGGGGQAAPPTAAPTAAAMTGGSEQEETKPSSSSASEASASLQDIAAGLAGGPGAIYVGDLNQLVGLAPDPELGDADGNVPLDALEKHQFIFESEHYQNLLKKANFENPTQLTYDGDTIDLQIVCISTSVTACKLRNAFYIPNVEKRTNGKVELQLVGYPELGIAGPDMLSLIQNGTVGFGEVYGGYVAGDLPALEIQYLWGLYRDHEEFYKATVAALGDTDRMISERTGDGQIMLHNWYTGQDQFFFCKEKITTLEEFKGKKTRSHGTALTDWIEGMGATAQFVAFAEVYVALERGILDCGVTGADAAWGQRWYEVTDYMVGPLTTMAATSYIMNKDVWDELPGDIQQILLEEGARDELEALRIATIQNLYGVPKLQGTGQLEFVEFSDELKDYSFNEVTLGRVIPQWVKRAGGTESQGVRIFNEKVGPIVGVMINPDGTASVTGAASTTAAASTAGVPATLTAYAAEHAGGPGAIYVGDLSQLVGPAPTPDQGDFDGGVSLEALQIDSYIYESDYYQSLIEKAKLTNPTELVTQGEEFTIQHACINRALLPCKVIDTYFRPNLLERTGGQLNFQVTSFPELGLAGPDTLSLVAEGTLESATIYGGYVAGELPPIEIQYLWGLYTDHETEFEAITSIFPDLENLILDVTGGVVVNHHWYAGVDQFFFCQDKITTLEEFKGKKTRSHGAALSDWINGMGATAQFVAFSEVYTALERGILDCGVTGADAAWGQRWYEVTKYMNGPLSTFNANSNIVNDRVWAKLPPDLQQIFLEEAAKSELEALRLAAAQNQVGVAKNVRDGLEMVVFSPELQAQSRVALMENVIPNFLNRVGTNDHPIVGVFNEKVGPLVGLIINPDGTVSEAPVTKQ